MDGYIGEVQNTDHLHHTVQLFFDLFKGLIIAEGTDGHTGDGRIFGGSNGEAVQVLGFSGKKAGNLGEDTHLIFHIEGDPSFLQFFFHNRASFSST